MKVLVLTSRFPFPPHRGDRVLAFQLIHELHRRGHDVTLVSFTEGGESTEARATVGALCRRVETVPLARWRSWGQAWLGLLSRDPSQVSYYRSAAMHQRIAGLWAGDAYDAVVVQMFRAAPFARELQHPVKVLFLTDSLALSLRRSMRYARWWRRFLLQWELRRVASFEIEISRFFRRAWVLSEVDAADLRERGCTNVAVVPYGVDQSLFELSRGDEAAPRVLFLGNMSVPHNRDAAVYLAREVWPLVSRSVSDASLELVGADPPQEVIDLGAIPGVKVTGLVPDLHPVWQRATVLAAPLRFGAGVQTKVLEAMAAGVPVVTTPQVAESLGARDREFLRVEEGASSIASALIEILRDPAAHRAMAERARALVRDRNRWDRVVGQLEREVAEAGGGA